MNEFLIVLKTAKKIGKFPGKILLVISDNGANIAKGIKFLVMRAQAERDIHRELENQVSEDQITDPEEHQNITSSEEWEQVGLIVENVAFRRFITFFYFKLQNFFKFLFVYNITFYLIRFSHFCARL